MSWDGSGNFTRSNGVSTGPTTWAQAEQAGRKIRSDDFDTHDQDIADGLENCLTRDGQNSPSANLPMNNRKHTGVADASARTEYAAWGQVQDAIAPKMETLTDAATIAWNCGTNPMARVTLGGNRTLTISGAVEGGTYGLWVQQDSTGGRSLTLPGGASLDTGDLPGTIDITAEEITFLSFIYAFGKLRLMAQRFNLS